ncbi:proto-oncogene Mas-like [Varanus komodoensis]|uniref:proto-oncogene Mas-like n=1 Tax=Varanus komodoensis TaxID=61221 RepID=UPI001CF7BDA2|nr:proto-oncogene Mas-like [Varanus komodoensis]
MAEAVSLSSLPAITIKKNYTQLGNWSTKEATPNFMEIIVIVSVPFCIWGLFGNTIGFWLLCCKVKRNRIIIYFLNLTVADFIVVAYYFTAFCLFLTPFNINIYFLRAMEIIYLFGYNASTYFLTVISATRFLVVFFPMWYQHHQPKTRLVCVFLWSCSFLMSLGVYIACFPRFLSSHNMDSSYCSAATISAITVNFCVFLPIMLFSTLAIFWGMQRKARQRLPAKLDIIIIIMVLLCLIFASSMRTVDAVSSWHQKLDSPFAFLLSVLFDSIKYSADPFVYILVACWKRKKTSEPIYMCVGRALRNNETVKKDTQVAQEQA